MKSDREPCCCPDDPAKPSVNIAAGTAQSAVLQLQIDGIELADFSADFSNMAVAEPAYATMPAAQQILVQIENAHVEDVAELPFEASRIGSDAA